MANEEHLAILEQGVEVWNEWREKNLRVNADISGANLNGINLSGANFSGAFLNKTNLSKTNFSKANLSNANLSRAFFVEANLTNANFSEVDLIEADLTQADFSGTNLTKANLTGANLNRTNLSQTNLSQVKLNGAKLIEVNFSGANLRKLDLSGVNLSWFNFSEADLSEAKLIRTQALNTNFYKAVLTGACIEDWHTNSTTNLKDVICAYIYLQQSQQERRPSSGNFALGEFSQLFQKSLETLDLIFRNGIDWDAFAYSFKKLEVENQDAQLDVQSIEKKGDGILVVRVAVAPNADKAKIHSEIIQGYELANKALEAQYQARLEDKDALIVRQEAQINRLFDIVEQQGSVQKALAENPRKVSNYDQRYSQFAGGNVDANTVDADQIGGNIQNNDA